MPIHHVTGPDDRPGYQWGRTGKIYTYDSSSDSSRKRAKRKAIMQGLAIKQSGYKEQDFMPTTSFSTVSLTEHVTCENLTLESDTEHNIIRGVKVLGMNSGNGRHYPRPTMQAALSLYENCRVNVDHITDGKSQRRYADRFGRLKNARIKEDGIYADLHYNPKHPLAEQFVWDATHSPENVGFSHDAHGRTRTHQGRVIVEEITKVRSVDLVADPATTAGLFEHQTPNPEPETMDLKDLTLDQLRKDRPDLLESLFEEDEQSKKLKALEESNKQLTEQLAKITSEKEAAERASKLDALLKEHKLDPSNPKHVSELFRESLLASPPEKWEGLIKDRAELALAANTGKPHTDTRHHLPESKSHSPKSYEERMSLLRESTLV